MNFPLFGTFLTILWFFLLIIWLSLVIWTAIDVFRDDRLSGGAKAGWLIAILLLPLLGTVIYLIARGDKTDAGRGTGPVEGASDSASASSHAHPRAHAHAHAHGESSQAADLANLADLKAKGLLTDEEFQRAKAKVLS